MSRIRVRFEPSGFEVDAEPGEQTADEFELEVLDILGDTPDKVRLCCQAKLIGGADTQVTLKVSEE